MSRGSIQLRHRKNCDAPSKPDARACRCAPTVYVVLERQWVKVGYLERGWRKTDLEPFEARLSEMRRKLAAGEPWEPRKVMRLAEYADQWFDDLQGSAQTGQVAKRTYNTYIGAWENHLAPAFGAMPLAAIDAAAIRRYVSAKLADGYAAVSVNSSLTPLSAMLTDAVSDGLLVANPARQPRRARHGGSRRNHVLAEAQRGAPKFLELHEARALLATTPAEHRPMVLAALTTGARRGELLALRWEDLDFAAGRVAIDGQLYSRERERCKCDSEREVPLYSGLAQMLGPRRQAEGYIFRQPDGCPWGDQGPERAFLSDAYVAAKLRQPGRGWHALRHTYASALAAGGVRRDVVERLMGHAGKGTTSIYTHLFRDAFDGVEEALEQAFGVNQASTGSGVTTGHNPGTVVPQDAVISALGGGSATVPAVSDDDRW